ncbi:MAG: hypothetical protein ACKVQS_08865 [Fimbriimonadaceae bacterium]
MSQIDGLVQAWDEFHWEYSLALENLADENVWKRPDPRLLSIGELTGHVCYSNAIRFLSNKDDADPSDVLLKSPLIDRKFRYYVYQVDEPVVLEMSAPDLASEFDRISKACKEVMVNLNPGYDELLPGRTEEMQGFTRWGMTLQYMLFHISYHAGQAYSVRHLLGDTPVDN